MTQTGFRLPRPVHFFLRWFADEEMLDSMAEELEIRYSGAVEESGFLKARFRRGIHIASLLLSFTIETFIWRMTMLRNYFKLALRHITRKKLYSFINIMGLTVGLACFILIGLWVKDELSFDRFHEKKDQIFRLMRKMPDGNSDWSVTYALAPALKDQFPEVEEMTRLKPWGGSLVRYKDKNIQEDMIVLGDPGFFKMFSFSFVHGSPETALKDESSVVLTEETAQRYFGDEDPMGKVIQLVHYRGDYTVSGVIKNIPLNSHIRFNMMARVEVLGEDRLARWDEWTGASYVLLRSGSQADFEANIADIYQRNLGPDTTYVPVLQSLERIHLYELGRPGQVKKVTMFSVIAVFILLMACINFMNLAIAQSARRAMEVGMRKVIGARRQQVVRQFLGEAVFIAFLSLFLAVVLVELVLPHFNRFTAKSLTLLSGGSLGIFLTLVLVTLLTGLLAGSYPALFMSSFLPAQTLRGRLSSGTRGVGFRKALIVVQFVISVGLITSTLIVSGQLRYIQDRDLGLDREHIVMFSNNYDLFPRYKAFKDTLLNQPGILNVTTGAQPPNRVQDNIEINWPGNPVDQMISSDYTVVNYDFFKTFNMEILQGRSFSPEFPADKRSACILNETAVARMGLEDPLGAEIYMNHPAWPERLRSVRVIGIVKDFHSRSLHTAVRPFVFRMYDLWQFNVFVKIDGKKTQAALARLNSTFEEYSRGYPLNYRFLDEVFKMQYTSERQLGQLFNAFSLLSIFIACLGLFGLSSYSIEQRTKEIGVRRILGASVSSLVGLTSKEFLKWVALANLIAWPLAYFLMNRWLQEFAYKVRITPLVFALAAGITLLISLLTVSYHSLHAAYTNPVDSLRYE
ncbi:ABC transporter permease [Acidobacteriota bacterium]